MGERHDHKHHPPAAEATRDQNGGDRQQRAQHASSLAYGLGQLAAAARGAAAAGPPAPDDSPLVAACRLVAGAQGITLGETAANRREDVSGIAAAAGAFVREVRLEPGWQSRDCGPLLGFRNTDGAPVALLRRGMRGYQCVDPATGRRSRVTAATAGELCPTACMFFRQLPQQPLRLRDLLIFGIHGRGRDLIRAGILALLLGCIGLVTPMVTKVVFSDVIPESDARRLYELVSLLLGFAVSSLLLRLGKDYALLRAETGAGHDVEAAVWERLVRQPAGFFRRFDAGDLAQRANGVNAFRMAVSNAAMSGVMSSLFGLLYFILMFWYDARLAWLALGLTVLLACASLVVNLVQLRYQRPMFAIAGKLSGITLQLLTAISKIKTSGAEDRAFSLWASHYARQISLARKSELWGAVLRTFTMVFEAAAPMALFAGVIWLSKSTDTNVGTFIGFWAAYGSLQAAALDLVTAVSQILDASPLIKRMKPILESSPETGAGKADPGEIQGHVAFSRVTFAYDPEARPVLQDVSFHAAPGEMVAVAGPSGAGKSTLVRLLLGFESPAKGVITVDGHDISSLDPVRLRRNMGVVLQNSGILFGNVYENIAGGRRISLDDAWEAARLAGLEETINELPMGMQTPVMAGGRTLSGGQRQRLLIARAMAARPRIIVFDEATSALDNQTQSLVARSLESLRCTRIVIAHRLSTIMHAQRIYVLDAGRIVEQGDYAQLMAQGGLFHRLASRQIV